MRFTANSANGNNLYLDNITIQQGEIDTDFGFYPSTVEFTDQTSGESSETVWVMVTNTGTDTMILPLSGVYFAGANNDQFTFYSDYFPLVVAGGTEQMIVCRFIPNSPGYKSANLHLVYHGEDHVVNVHGTAHATPSELWERFEGTVFPPDMWDQIGTFSSSDGISIHGESAATSILTLGDPEQKLITPYLDVLGINENLSFYVAGINNMLGYGGTIMQVNYQLYETNTWTNLGSPINFMVSEAIRKETRNLSALPQGIYRFEFVFSSTFSHPGSASGVVLDDISGPCIHNNGVLETPKIQLSYDRTLSWTAIPNARTYEILSSDNFEGTFTHLANSPACSWLDPTVAVRKFYKVKASSIITRPEATGFYRYPDRFAHLLNIAEQLPYTELFK